MTLLRISTEEIEGFVHKLEALPELTMQEAMLAMRKATAAIEQQVVPRTPVNTGALKAAWSTRISRGQGVIKGEVSNPKEYAIVVEKGRRPGARRPPTDVIEYWVTRKFGVRGREAESLAYVIARSIGRKGIKGRKMLEEGVKAATPTVTRLFEQVPKNVVKKTES